MRDVPEPSNPAQWWLEFFVGATILAVVGYGCYVLLNVLLFNGALPTI